MQAKTTPAHPARSAALKALLAIAAGWAGPMVTSLAQAQAQSPASAASAASAVSADLADGEVRKIDLEGGKLTLRHGEIKHLDMPPMTMVFAVQDKAWLARLKPGDKLKFKAIDLAGTLTITQILPAP